MIKYVVLGLMLLLAAGVGLPLLVHSGPQAPPSPQLSEKEQEYRRFVRECVHYVPPMPPYLSPPVVDGALGSGELNPDELVICVTINGASRAYPLNMMDTPDRKVVNDIVGGEPILVTWCDNCHTAAVFSRRINGREELFACSGMLWQRTLVIYDVATKSFWNHVLGKCVAGERSGERLPELDATITTWGNWLAKFPSSTVVLRSRQSDRLRPEYYSREHQLRDFVFGVRGAAQSRAWTFAMLHKEPVLNTSLGDQPVLLLFDPQRFTARMFVAMLENEPLSFTQTKAGLQDDASGSTWNPLTGQALTGKHEGKYLRPVPGVTCFLAHWDVFFPDSIVHGRGET